MKNSIYILLAGTLWGIISIFIKVLNSIGFNSLQCVAIRAFFSAVILFLYIFYKDKNKFKIALKDIRYFLGTGICSIVLFNYCYFESIELIGGAAIPALLLYTAPIFVIILSAIFFKERITLRKFIALIITFVGLGFVTGAFTAGERMSIMALMLGLGSGLGYALYSIFGKLIVDKYDAITITFYTFLVAAICVLPISGVVENINLIVNWKGISASLGLALFSTVLPFLLYTKGLHKVEAGKASILATVEPFVAAVIGVLLFNEKFTLIKIIGMIMILSAIIYLNSSSKNFDKTDN
jgi:drug/metabolite transporter (DMT)-like permease